MRALVGGTFGALVATAVVVVACGPNTGRFDLRAPWRTGAALVTEDATGRLAAHDRMARIALAGSENHALVSATGRWRIDEQGGRERLVAGLGAEQWWIEQRGRLLRVAGAGGDATPWREAPFVARAEGPGSALRFGARRYRGELWFTPTDSGILVVNRLPVEEYLRGVVPLELGTREASDHAALEAQAIAARSYAYIRVPSDASVMPRSGWHMLATVQHQVYGGMDVEAPIVNAAIDRTAGLVLRYAGVLVDAPYYASCGGRTAAPTDSWRDVAEEPYLQGVDDTDPRTGRPYCDISPRNHWTTALDEGTLRETARLALVAAGARDPRPGVVTGLRVEGRAASGRATRVVLQTDRGDVTLRYHQIRTVLRNVRGGILPSTYFSVDRESGADGHLSGVNLHGHGHGHGVGMCQWGAIGRSRAGLDARTILRHYYPGTVVGFAD